MDDDLVDVVLPLQIDAPPGGAIAVLLGDGTCSGVCKHRVFITDTSTDEICVGRAALVRCAQKLWLPHIFISNRKPTNRCMSQQVIFRHMSEQGVSRAKLDAESPGCAQLPANKELLVFPSTALSAVE